MNNKCNFSYLPSVYARTNILVTDLEASVTARKGFSTFLTTRNILNVTHNVAANHSATVTGFTNQLNAGGTGSFTMTSVTH